MSGAFDAFLYVPASPPVTPSPTKRKAGGRTLAVEVPNLEDSPHVLLPSPRSIESKKRSLVEVKDAGDGEQEGEVLSRPRQSHRLLRNNAQGTPTPPASSRLVPADDLHSSSSSTSPTPRLGKKESTTTLTRKKKKRRPARAYADPSLYAHLPQSVADTIAPGLTLLIIGLNPGVMTASTGYHFANPTNLFWPLLYSSRIIHEPLKAQDSHLLPTRYSVGITNIVSRPSAEGGELSKAECIAGALATIERVRKWQPRAIALTGKGIWEAMFRAIHGRPIKASDAFQFGWQAEIIQTDGIRIADSNSGDRASTIDDEKADDDTGGGTNNGWQCRIFVTMGTSGRVAAYTPAFKREVFAQLGEWINRERDRQQRMCERLQTEIEDNVKVEPQPPQIFADDEALDGELKCEDDEDQVAVLHHEDSGVK